MTTQQSEVHCAAYGKKRQVALCWSKIYKRVMFYHVTETNRKGWVIFSLCQELKSSVFYLVLHIWQCYLTFSHTSYLTKLRGWVSFYQWGHFVTLMIRYLNLISVQSWTYLGPNLINDGKAPTWQQVPFNLSRKRIAPEHSLKKLLRPRSNEGYSVHCCE